MKTEPGPGRHINHVGHRNSFAVAAMNCRLTRSGTGRCLGSKRGITKRGPAAYAANRRLSHQASDALAHHACAFIAQAAVNVHAGIWSQHDELLPPTSARASVNSLSWVTASESVVSVQFTVSMSRNANVLKWLRNIPGSSVASRAKTPVLSVSSINE